MKSGGKKNMSLRVKIRASFFKSNRCNSVKIVVLAWSSFFPRRCNAPLPFFFSGRRGETKEYKDKRREEKWKRKLSLGNCPFFFTSLQVVRRGGGGGGGGGVDCVEIRSILFYWQQALGWTSASRWLGEKCTGEALEKGENEENKEKETETGSEKVRVKEKG